MSTEQTILTSAAAYAEFGDLLHAAAPEARFLLASPERVIDCGTGKQVREVRPTIAWLSSDLFAGGSGVAWFASLFINSPALRWVHSSTAGLDSPVFGKLRERGVRVTGAHIYGPQISEFVLREALDHLQHAAAWRAGQLTRSWAPHDFREMAGTTWLVIGLGEIGGRIARTAHALGARVLGSARHEPTDLSGMAEYVSPDAVTDRLGDADVVVIARPALDDAVLVDRPFLDAMAPDSLLVNISRGSLVDEVALLAALDAGRPARAVLDVFASEPLPTDSPLWSHPKVVVTPHTSGQGDGRFARGAQVFAKLLRA